MKQSRYLQWGVTALVGVFFVFVFPRVWWWPERRYERQTELYHRRLLDILNQNDELKRHDSLQELAREVGAGFERTDIVDYYKIDEHATIIPQNRISESELVQNIHGALQTRTMIVASRAAAKSYIVAFAAVVVSGFAAIAAWQSAKNAKEKVTSSTYRALGSSKKEKQEMREEPVQSFPLPNERELAYVFIKTELENAGFEVQRISIDDTVTTNKEVPEEIKTRICEYAADKGITITFEVGSVR